MAKRRLSLKVHLPLYHPPRNRWRRAIHHAALLAKRQNNISYVPSDKLEVHVILNLDPSAALIHDVDNRLKDVLDALQGRAGGPKAAHRLQRIIPNDKLIYRVLIEKSARSDNKRPRGLVVVRELQRRGAKSA